MKTIISVMLVSALALFYPQPIRAQRTRRSDEEIKALRREIEALKEGQQAIQRELQEIKSLLLAKQAPAPSPAQPAVISVGNDPFLGDKNARVVMIDFSDYQ
jgi:protein-disulfide isomerase